MADAPQVADTVADAPEVAHAEPCPEAIQSHPRSALPHGAKWVNDPQDSHYVATGSSPPKMVLGLRRRNVCIICVITFLLVGAIIGGSVGGIAAVQNKNVGYASTPQSANILRHSDEGRNAKSSNRANAPPQACITSFNPMSSRIIESPTPGLSHTTASGVSSSSHEIAFSTTASDPFSRYTPQAPSSVYMIETACLYNRLRSFSGDTFDCNYDTDINQFGDLTALVAYTPQTCVDACSKLNEMTGTSACKAVTVVETLAAEYVTQGANCFLKNTTGPSARRAGVMLAVMTKRSMRA